VVAFRQWPKGSSTSLWPAAGPYGGGPSIAVVASRQHGLTMPRLAFLVQVRRCWFGGALRWVVGAGSGQSAPDRRLPVGHALRSGAGGRRPCRSCAEPAA